MEKSSLIVSLYGGPCTCKSTICAGVFSKLKWARVTCEMPPEYAKGIVFEDSLKKLENQIYIFGKQHNIINRLIGKVDVILVDSPLLLSLHYAKGERYDVLKQLVVSEYKRMNNLDILLVRTGDGYDQTGRTQNHEEAKAIDADIKNILDQHVVNYHTFAGEKETEDKITKLILERLGKHGS